MTITNVIPVKANGVHHANEMTVPITWKPNDLYPLASFLNLTKPVPSVTANSLETDATMTTCSDRNGTSNPSATR